MVGAFNGFSSAANRIENVPAPYFLFPSVASPTFFPRARRSARPLAVPSNKTEPYMESIDLQDRSWSVERKWEIALVLLRRAHFPSKKETSLWRLIGKRQTVGDGPKRIRWRTELERCDLSDIINVRLFFRPTTVERIELGSHIHTHQTLVSYTLDRSSSWNSIQLMNIHDKLGKRYGSSSRMAKTAWPLSHIAK